MGSRYAVDITNEMQENSPVIGVTVLPNWCALGTSSMQSMGSSYKNSL